MIRLFAALAFLIISQPSFAGDMVRNGGDLIVCDSAEFAGHTSAVLDFAAALTTTSNPNLVLPFETVSDLSMAIREKNQALADDLSHFLNDAVAQLGGYAKPHAFHQWKPSKLKLLNISDEELAERERLIASLPDSCIREAEGKKVIQLRQLVAREKETGRNRTTFYFDAEAMKLIEKRPDQLSFLLIHEWLWSHAKHANTVRELNWYLHSHEWKDMEGVEFLHALASMGFNFATDKTDVSPIIRIVPAGGLEPNGHERFKLPDHAIISEQTTKITFSNLLHAKVTVGAYLGGQSRELCTFQDTCVIEVSKIGEFPAALWVQQEPMRDPVWDIKFISLFK